MNNSEKYVAWGYGPPETPTGPVWNEGYSPNDPVCNNQNDFNQAFRNAVTYNNQQNVKKAQLWIWLYLSSYVILMVWGLFLAMQVPDPNNRVIHIVFAIVFAPVYLIAYYLGMLKRNM